MKSKSLAAAIAVAISTSLALVGCSGASASGTAPSASTRSDPALNKLIADAQKEGTVTFYSTSGQDELDALAAAFQHKYNIKMVGVRAPSAQLLTRYQTENAAGGNQTDLLMMSPLDYFQAGIKSGEFIKLDSKNLPAMSTWPSSGVVSGGAIVTDIALFGFAYNTDLVKTPPKTWKDLLNSDYSRKVAAVDWSATIQNLEFLDYLKDTYGDTYLTKFAALKPTLYASGQTGAQSLAAGEKAVAFPMFGAFTDPLITQGAPIKFVVPKNTSGSLSYAGIPSKANHPAAARLLLNYIMTPEGQSVLVKGGTSMLPNVPGTVPLPKGYVAPDQAKANADKDELLKLMEQ